MTAKSAKDSKAIAGKKIPPAASKPKGKPVAPATKLPAKAAPKAVQEPAQKAAAKAVTKAAPKAVAKTPAKTTVKPVVKSAPKALAKPVMPAKKVVIPATVKRDVVVAKSVVKPVSKPISTPRAPVSPAPMPVSKTSVKPEVITKTKTPATSAPVAEKAVPAPVSPAPAKAGRPSSRLAQLTVPSIAQTVASTAAKASYTQSTPVPLIVPVLPSSIKKDAKLANNWKTTPAGELTDAELMAMPDAEYMNSVQMAAFRARLMKLKLDILNSAGETTEHLREDTSVVPDPADRATIEEEHALELRTRDRERKLLKKIEQSIVRIDAGDYGYCDETGEPIGVGRLLARPTATLSLEAQQRRELKQKMFGD